MEMHFKFCRKYFMFSWKKSTCGCVKDELETPILEGYITKMQKMEGQNRVSICFMCLKLLGYLGSLLDMICVCLNLSCGKWSIKQKLSVAVLSIMGTLISVLLAVGSLIINIQDST